MNSTLGCWEVAVGVSLTGAAPGRGGMAAGAAAVETVIANAKAASRHNALLILTNASSGVEGFREQMPRTSK